LGGTRAGVRMGIVGSVLERHKKGQDGQGVVVNTLGGKAGGMGGDTGWDNI